LCTSDQQKKLIISTKFGSNWPSGFREEDKNEMVCGRHTPSDGNTSNDPLGQVS